MKMKLDTSNVLAIVGAASVVIGVSILSIAAGLICLGVLLIVGAVATAAPREPNEAQMLELIDKLRRGRDGA